MAHPRKSLRPGEKVILDSRPHWWYFARPVMLLAVSILVALVIMVSADDLDSESTLERSADSEILDFGNSNTGLSIGNGPDNILQILASVLVIFAIAQMLVTIVTWYFTHFFVSNQRVVLRSGVLNREGVEIPIDRVNTVFFEQNLVERIVGAGDVLVESAGESGVQRFFDIANPLAVKERLREVVEAERKQTKTEVRKTPPEPPARVESEILSITDQIRDLNDLREQEIISDEEFEAKKAELLARI